LVYTTEDVDKPATLAATTNKLRGTGEVRRKPCEGISLHQVSRVVSPAKYHDPRHQTPWRGQASRAPQSFLDQLHREDPKDGRHFSGVVSLKASDYQDGFLVALRTAARHSECRGKGSKAWHQDQLMIVLYTQGPRSVASRLDVVRQIIDVHRILRWV